MKRLGKEKTLGIMKKGIKGNFERGTGRKIEEKTLGITKKGIKGNFERGTGRKIEGGF
jgi:hypothetical protein